MSDDLRFASKDEASFVWPATERRTPPDPEPRPPWGITRRQRENLRRLRRAQDLARKWQREDDDVTIQDIVDALLRDA